MSRVGDPPRGAAPDESGIATVLFPLLLWAGVLACVALVDVTAYLVAAARAQALADAAALAAVSADAGTVRTDPPEVEARRVAEAGEGRLETCRCAVDSEAAAVEVSTEVPGLVIPRLGARRVVARAEAVLAPPDELAPGPTRERARWLEQRVPPEP